MAPYGYEYRQVRSSQAVQWSGNFNSTIPFVYKTETNRWVNPRECYLAVKLRIVQTDAAGNQLTMRPISDANGNLICYPYIVKNPVATLFSTAKCLINDKLISNMNEVSATNTLYKTLYDTKTMQETIESTNPIFCQSISNAAPAISSITIPTVTNAITATSTSVPVIPINTVINGVTVLTAVNIAFNADAASATISTPATNIVLSYNNYYFTYTLPPISCTLTQATSVVIPAITIPIPILTFPNRAFYSQKCQLLFNQFNEQILTWSLPLSLFQANEWIPPHTKVELDFNVSSYWFNEIIGFVGQAPAGGVVQLSSATNTVNNSIGVGVDDIILWNYVIDEQSAVNISK